MRAVAAVEAGTLDYAQVDPFESGDPGVERRLIARYGPYSDAARAGRQQLFVQPAPELFSFAFNTLRGPFKDATLRRAVNFAIDRRALARHTGLGSPGRPTDQYIPPGVPGFHDVAVYPLGGPDLATARRLARRAPRHAVLYTCNTPGCTRHAQILRANLRAIGISLTIRQFPLGSLFEHLAKPGEPFDLAYSNWFSDYADPFSVINVQYGRNGPVPTRLDPALERRMEAAARLSGADRLRAYARLDRDLTERAPPAAVFASGTVTHFVSARIGCPVLQPLYGLDLVALCVREGRGPSR